MTISRRRLMGGAGCALASLAVPSRASRPNPANMSNIVFIMVDDLGYADLSFYGRREYMTPAIDRLASEGVRLTSAYANSPVCSATRIALITGRYQYRLPAGLEEPLGPQSRHGLPLQIPTMPSVLRDAGFHASLIGKWHMGQLPDYSPLHSGYDEFWGIRGGGVDYFSHEALGRGDLWDGDQRIEATGYLTDLLGQRAVEVIDRRGGREQPFFLSRHFTAPHWPWEGPSDAEGSARLRTAKGLLVDRAPTDREIFWRYPSFDQQAARSGRWKYLKLFENTFLFDVEADPLERANLKDRYPQVFGRLEAAFRSWDRHHAAVGSQGFNARIFGRRIGRPFRRRCLRHARRNDTLTGQLIAHARRA